MTYQIRVNIRGVMSKKCISCDLILSEKAKMPNCKKCRHKIASLKWIEKNKEKFLQYQKEYREENRELCNQRTRKSYWKNPKKYNESNRIHYREVNGISIDDPFRKRKNGEGNIDSSGYKTITKKGHANQMDDNGRIREHVYVMSEKLGRPLYKGESVHHKNGDRLDNRIENLELWDRGQPPGQRVKDKIEFYLQFLSKYGEIFWKPFDNEDVVLQ